MARKMYRLMGFLLIVNVCQAQPDELTGGATGDDNHQFVDGTADVPKILLGLTCEKKNPDAPDEVELTFYVNQGDDDFKYESSATVLNADELILYETCYFIDAAAYANSKSLNKATSHSYCNNNVEFTTLDSSAADTSYERRTKTASLKVPDPTQATDYKCGSTKDGGDIEVAVYCKREADYDKAFDVVFTATYGTDGCVASMAKTNLEVANPPTVDVKYNLDVTMKAYIQPSGIVIDGPVSPPANEVTGVIPLGTAIYLEVCLEIPQVQPGATNINNQFFSNGVGPICIIPHSCTARANINSNDFQSNIEAMTDWPTIVDETGCGPDAAADKGIEQYFKREHIFEWLKDSGENNGHLMSPNCFKTMMFPAISFARADADDTVDTIFTCKLNYGTSGTDNRCFGNQAGGSSDYPDCSTSMAAKRRKRETITVGQGLPTEASVLVQVIIPESNVTSSAFDGCFEKKAFIGLTSAMMTILLAVLIAAVFLAVKLKTAEPESSTDSMTGIKNKGYF